MSVFASQIKKQVPLGDGDGAIVVTIRKLSGKSLEKAFEARQIAQIETARKAGADLVKLFREMDAAKLSPPTDAAARVAARYGSYDRDTVLMSGIEALSVMPAGVKFPDAIADLDQATADLLHREIIDLSLGPIDSAEVEAEGKGA